jgi:hypothetical protein
MLYVCFDLVLGHGLLLTLEAYDLEHFAPEASHYVANVAGLPRGQVYVHHIGVLALEVRQQPLPWRVPTDVVGIAMLVKRHVTVLGHGSLLMPEV